MVWTISAKCALRLHCPIVTFVLLGIESAGYVGRDAPTSAEMSADVDLSMALKFGLMDLVHSPLILRTNKVLAVAVRLLCQWLVCPLLLQVQYTAIHKQFNLAPS